MTLGVCIPYDVRSMRKYRVRGKVFTFILEHSFTTSGSDYTFSIYGP